MVIRSTASREEFGRATGYPTMHFVAIVALGTPIETEAAALARDLGTTAYEERLKLAAGLPAIVLMSADPSRAMDLSNKLRARGHQVVSCAGADVIASQSMVTIRRFELSAGELTLPDVPAQRLPYAAILAFVRAMQTKRTETTSEVTDKKFAVGRAIATGGLLLSKSVKREETSVTNEREQVLYIFRRDGGVPWLLHERGINYSGLGPKLEAAAARNFVTTIQCLRESAPHAAYDERLMSSGNVSRHVRVSSGGDKVSASSAGGVDMLAHVIARSIAEGAR